MLAKTHDTYMYKSLTCIECRGTCKILLFCAACPVPPLAHSQSTAKLCISVLSAAVYTSYLYIYHVSVQRNGAPWQVHICHGASSAMCLGTDRHAVTCLPPCAQCSPTQTMEPAIASLRNPMSNPVQVFSLDSTSTYVQMGEGEQTYMFVVKDNQVDLSTGVSSAPRQGLAAIPGGYGAVYFTENFGRPCQAVLKETHASVESNLQELNLVADVYQMALDNPAVARGLQHVALPMLAGCTVGEVNSIAADRNMLPEEHLGTCAETTTRLYALLPALKADMLAMELSEYTPAVASSLCAHLLTGMSGLHAAGLTHRDMKPDNFMIGFDNKGYVIDLGLAKYKDEDGKVTPNSCNWCSAPESGFGPQGKVNGDAYDAYTVGLVMLDVLTKCLMAQAEAIGAEDPAIEAPHIYIRRLMRMYAAAEVHFDMWEFGRANEGADVLKWLKAVNPGSPGYPGCSLVTDISDDALAELFEDDVELVASFCQYRKMAVRMLAIDPERRAVPVDLVQELPIAADDDSETGSQPVLQVLQDRLLDGPRELAKAMLFSSPVTI